MTEECCPKFDPVPWDGKVLEWSEKRFVKDHVLTFFFIPLNFGGVVTRLIKKIDGANAKIQDYLSLSDHTSNWNMDLYCAVDREIP